VLLGFKNAAEEMRIMKKDDGLLNGLFEEIKI